MIDEKLEKKLLKVFEDRYKDYNTKVLTELGQVIKEIGDLIPKDAYRLGQQLKYNTTVKKLVKELSSITKMSQNDVYKVLEKVAKENLGFAETYYKAKELNVPIYKENKALQNLVKSVYKTVGKELKNISKSSGIVLLDSNGKKVYLSIDKAYKEIVDRGIIAISQGKETYYQTMRDTMEQLAESGVRYISYDNVGKTFFGRTVKKAYSQRIDTAVRRNVLDGIRQVSNESQILFGEEFGADGIEISVHEIPAPDHEIVQGRQFSKEEYKKLQEDGTASSYTGKKIDIRTKSGSFRPISTLNCYHYVFSIILGISKPVYSDKKLQKIIDNKNKTFEFNGKIYNMYEGTQLQRKIETAIRKEKDTQILAKESGDEELVLKSQLRITQLNKKYKRLSNVSNLTIREQRTFVSGYRKVKAEIKNAPEIEYARENNVIWHSTENLEEIIKDNELISPSFAVGKELNTKVKYGTQFVEFKPEILQYVDENTLLYRGDGGNKFSRKGKQFSSLMQMLKDKPKYYNELKFANNLKLNKYIKKVYVRQDEPEEVINLLKKHKIDYEAYTDYRKRGFKKKTTKEND